MSEYENDPLLAEAIARRDESRAMVLRARGVKSTAVPAKDDQAAATVDPGSVSIPDNWHELPWIPENEGDLTLRGLASSLADDPIRSKADAVAAIEAELKRRG